MAHSNSKRLPGSVLRGGVSRMLMLLLSCLVAIAGIVAIAGKSETAQAATYKVTVLYSPGSNGTFTATADGKTTFRVSGGVIQYTTDGKTWKNSTHSVSGSERQDLANVNSHKGSIKVGSTTYNPWWHIKRVGYHVRTEDAWQVSSNKKDYRFFHQDDTAAENPSKKNTVTAKRLNNGASLTANKTVTLTPNWHANNITISFNAGGGTGSMTAATYAYDGTTKTKANAFTRTGYHFSHWTAPSGNKYTNQQDLKTWLKDNGMDIATTWTANWLANTYTVTFNANGGTGSMAKQTFTYDKAAALTRNAFTRTGYDFAGWTTAANGTGASYTNGQSVKNLTATNNGNVTLYAKWTKKTYAVTYNLNGGNANGASHNFAKQTKTYDTALTLYAQAPAREGYRFMGWGTTATATSPTYAAGASYTANAAVTLYALWTPTTVTLQFDPNDGTGTMDDQKIDTDKYQTLDPNKYSRTFHTFMWWNTEKDGSGSRYIDQQRVKEVPVPTGSDLKLYAQWELDPYAGTAYALLMDDGTLLLFRSGETYQNDTVADVTDTAGKSYHGRVFTGVETIQPASASDVPWHAHRGDIKATRVASKQRIRPKSYAYWYSECENLDKATGDENPPKTSLTGFEATMATSTKDMFSGCSSLRKADLSSFAGDTSLTDMSGMFSGCSSLKSANLYGCGTGGVTTMASMFEGCSAMVSADIAGWNTSSVTTMASMFKGCSALSEIDVAGFNTSAVTDFSHMFDGCSTIDAIDVSGFDTSHAETMEAMFSECSHLTYLDLGRFVSSGDTRQSDMFAGTKRLAYVNLGPSFAFNGSSLLKPPMIADSEALLDPADSDHPERYMEYLSLMVTSGKWKKADGQAESRTAEELASTYSGATAGMPGGWCWEPFSGDDETPAAGIAIFCGNGGHVSPSIINTETSINPVTMPDASRNGYILTGWNTSQDGTGTAYEVGESYHILAEGETRVVFAQWDPVPPYQLGGAVYRIYADSNCEDLIAEVETNPDGTCDIVELPIGTYYVREYRAPRDFEIDPEAYPVEITDDAETPLIVSEKELRGSLQVRKQSADPETTEGNVDYSFEGATFQVYSNPTCASDSLVGTLVCEGNGFSNVLEDLDLGKYYVCETVAPPGYVLDPTPHEVELTADNSTSTTVVTIPNGTSPQPLSLDVGKRVTGRGAPSNEQFMFTVSLSPRMETVRCRKLTAGGIQELSLTSDASGNVTFPLRSNEMMSLCDIPENTQYAVSETASPLYETTWEGPQSGTLVNGTNGATPAYRVIAVNEYKSGSVSVKKLYVGDNDDGSTTWDFKITLFDDQGTLTGTYGGHAFNGDDGYGFSLHANEEITFDGIPIGTRYKVEELGDDRSTTVSWENQEGTISADGDRVQRVTATNTQNEAKARIRKKMQGGESQLFWVADNELYSVKGAVYGLFSDEECTMQEGEFTTVTDDGKSDVLDNIVPGEYFVKELAAPKGLALDPTAYPVTLEASTGEDDVTEIEMADDLLLRTADILIQKRDASIGENDVHGPSQGNATLAGARFQVDFYEGYEGTEDDEGTEGTEGTEGDEGGLPETPTRTWVLQTDEDGIASLNSDYLVEGSSELFSNEGQIYLPLGTLKIKEIQAPAGYLLDPSEYLVPITPTDEDDPVQMVELSGIDTTYVSETPIRGGLKVKKADATSNAGLAGAVFGIYNKSAKPVKIGSEWYEPDALCGTITSDSNGIASTETFVPGSGDALTEEDAEDGAVLPYGVYSVTEMEAPTGYTLNNDWEAEATIDGSTQIVDLTANPCLNDSPDVEIGTILTTDGNEPGEYVGDTGFQANKQIALDGSDLNTTVYDKVECTNLQAGEYVLKGWLVNAATGEKIVGSDGQTQFSIGEFTEEATIKTVQMKLVLSNVSDQIRIVAYEELYKAPVTEQSKPIAEHKDLNEYEQTISVYSVHIGTTLMINNKHDHIMTDETELSLSDIVAYENLATGRQYVLTGKIHAKDAEDHDLGVVAEATATLSDIESPNGTASVSFAVTVANLPEKTKALVAFERLYVDGDEDGNVSEDDLVATHEDLKDENQTIVLHTPGIGTSLTASSGNQEKQIVITKTDRSGTLCDTVSYQDLMAGEYKLEGVLHKRKDGKSTGTAGAASSVTFSLTADDPSSGTKEVTLPFDLTGTKDDDVDGLVAYERLYLKVGSEWKQIATHEEIGDEGQTVIPRYPGIGTTLSASGGDKSILMTESGKDIQLTDTVAYSGLIEGHQYRLVGELHGKSSAGADLGGIAMTSGTTVTKDFTATGDGSGTEALDMPMNTGVIGGDVTAVVAFEKLYEISGTSQTEIAQHCEIGDEGQTVTILRPSIGTTLRAADAADGKTIVPTNGKTSITLTDTVSYENLIPGREYVLHASLHLRSQATGNPAIAIGGNGTVEIEHPFTPASASGTEDVTMTVSLGDVAKGDLVAYETLYLGTDVIARHEKIDSPAQTVTLYQPGIGTKLVDGNGYSDLTYDAGKTIELIDTVSYTGLAPNASYVITGTLHRVAEDGSDGGAIDGVTASSTVQTNETGEGVARMSFQLPLAKVDTRKLVAFERMFASGDETNPVAVHEDITDELQTVTFHTPSIGTTLVTQDQEHQKDLQVGYDESIVLNDVVRYSGLIPSRSYTLTATLRSKADGSEIQGATGTATFTASESGEGEATVPITVNRSSLPDGGTVAFERLSIKLETSGGETSEELVATHEDINDEDQTIAGHKPEIATTLVTTTGSKEIIATSGEITLVDTVRYRNLIPGKEYVLSGILHRKNPDGLDGGPMAEEPSTATFTPDTPDGETQVELKCNLSSTTVEKLVAFEQLRIGDLLIASHEDINDEDQSVLVRNPRIGTTLKSTDGKKEVTIKETQDISLVDTIAYEDLIPGLEYEASGILHVRKNGKDEGPLEGAIGSVRFTPDSPNGTIDVPFKVSSADATQELVAFEKVTLVVDGTPGETPVAEHTDISDESQSFSIRLAEAVPDVVQKPRSGGVANDLMQTGTRGKIAMFIVLLDVVALMLSAALGLYKKVK